MNSCLNQKVLGSPAAFLWLPFCNIHCIYFIEESLKILEISGIRFFFFSGNLDSPSEHHSCWFLTRFQFRYLLWGSHWRERRKITLQSPAKLFWGGLTSGKTWAGIRKGEMWLRNIFAPFSTHEAFQLITEVLVPYVWGCYIVLVICICTMPLPMAPLTR